jgi:uncharacterized protein (DUF1697 family)
MKKYVAFLRGINVGGKNVIKMDELRTLFISTGLKDVITYIQSGNVIFTANEDKIERVVKKIEAKLCKKLSADVLVFILSMEDLKKIVLTNPFKKMKLDIQTKLYVSFVKEVLKNKPKLPYSSPKKNVEIIKIKDKVIFTITPEINGRFGFPNNFIEEEFGIHATTRNWNTLVKILSA